MARCRLSSSRGLTFIELLIVVAIIGILAAIAYPGYQQFVRDGRRADAKTALVGLASAMERYYSANRSYHGAAKAHVPTIYAAQVPVAGGEAHYQLRIHSADADGYVLRAIPVNAQAGDGFLQLDSTGRRAWDRNNDKRIVAPGESCWQAECL